MPKTTVTRTFNPIHFEDLDPHRFEDLIRELIYDYRDWRTIEALGRSGNDGGFDIRAFENAPVAEPDDEQNEGEPPPALEGNRWMIQGKRERSIGPAKLRRYLDDVDTIDPPYGYILAAPAEFSKQSHDLFRTQLRNKGVMEFELWTRSKLEDLLHQPKNDRILFTFFGISLVTRRRSRATEIRTLVNNKNKLLRVLGEHPAGTDVLLRDAKDTEYPWKSRVADFDVHPRWKALPAAEYHPKGLLVELGEYLAHVDLQRKEFDYYEALNLIMPQTMPDDDRRTLSEQREPIEDFWRLRPRANQAKFKRIGLVPFDRILVIDDKGDVMYHCPHIYVDFDRVEGPTSGAIEFLLVNQEKLYLDEFQRVDIFPKKIEPPARGVLVSGTTLKLSGMLLSSFKNSISESISVYLREDLYPSLKPGDIVEVPAAQDTNDTARSYAQLTYRTKTSVEELAKQDLTAQWHIERQLGEDIKPGDVIYVYEFRRIYEWKFRDRLTIPS